MGDADVLGLAAVEGGAAEEAAFFAAGGEAVAAVEALCANYGVLIDRPEDKLLHPFASALYTFESLLVITCKDGSVSWIHDVPGYSKRRDDLVPNLGALHLRAGLHHRPRELVPEDEARRRRLETPKNV